MPWITVFCIKNGSTPQLRSWFSDLSGVSNWRNLFLHIRRSLIWRGSCRVTIIKHCFIIYSEVMSIERCLNRVIRQCEHRDEIAVYLAQLEFLKSNCSSTYFGKLVKQFGVVWIIVYVNYYNILYSIHVCNNNI